MPRRLIGLPITLALGFLGVGQNIAIKERSAPK
jgi:hypothetical protein